MFKYIMWRNLWLKLVLAPAACITPYIDGFTSVISGSAGILEPAPPKAEVSYSRFLKCSSMFQLLADFESSILIFKSQMTPKIENPADYGFLKSSDFLNFSNQVFKINHKLKQTRFMTWWQQQQLLQTDDQSAL